MVSGARTSKDVFVEVPYVIRDSSSCRLTVSRVAIQSESSKILFAAFGDPNRTAAQFLVWYRFPKINQRINFLENDANYQVLPRGGDYARDPPMGYLSLYIHLDIQPFGRMSRYDPT